MTDALPDAALSPPDAFLELEFEMPLERVRGLLRLASGRRSRPASLVWYDTGGSELATDGLSLREDAGRWRLERLWPTEAKFWPPGAPAPLLTEAGEVGALGVDLPRPLVPVAAFQGRRRLLRLELDGATPIEAELLEGRLRGVAADAPTCRLRLRGAPDLLGPACRALAEARLRVPHATLASDAIRVARGVEPPPRLGSPAVPVGAGLSDAVALVIGHLTAVMLHWSDPAAAGHTPEAVHQMRVATRRLRSALSVFRAPAACPEVEALHPALREFAALLGAARDWDVFLEGVGATLAAAMPEEQRLAALLAAAHRRRDAAYAGLRDALAGPVWRELQLALACAAVLRPWERGEDPAQQEALRRPIAEHAASILTRRRKRVRKQAAGLRTLPVEALHDLRKSCKKLRYAADIFTSQFPDANAKRFNKRLAALQEALGALNDGAVAAALMASLGRGAGGFAAGVVTGYVAAQSGDARADIRRAWASFRDTEPFWI